MAVTWEEGCAEPWIGGVLQALLKCYQHHPLRVAETGGFIGYTSSKLAEALTPEDELIVCEIDPFRAGTVQATLEGAPCRCTVICDDVMRWIQEQPQESLDLVWLDDAHEKQHVFEEIEALLPKMRPGGLIAGHDVYGITELHEVFAKFGGYSLALPYLGPAGGLGLLQA